MGEIATSIAYPQCRTVPFPAFMMCRMAHMCWQCRDSDSMLPSMSQIHECVMPYLSRIVSPTLVQAIRVKYAVLLKSKVMTARCNKYKFLAYNKIREHSYPRWLWAQIFCSASPFYKSSPQAHQQKSKLALLWRVAILPPNSVAGPVIYMDPGVLGLFGQVGLTKERVA
jgi:hypothetical protein